MIDAISEAAFQQGARLVDTGGAQLQEAEIKKADKKRELRPVERSEDSPRPELEFENSEELKRRTVIERGEIIIEKYDSDGKLVRKTPPGYILFDEEV